jgi:protein disulfide-isomerase
MKKRHLIRIGFWTLVIGLILAIAWVRDRATAGPDNEIAWVDSFEKAKQQAAATNQPMMLYFTADWCPPCQQMKRDLWPRDRVEQLVNDAVVPVYLDVDQTDAQALGYEYQAEYIPTIVFTDAAGRVLTDPSGAEMRLTGLIDADALFKLIDAANTVN